MSSHPPDNDQPVEQSSNNEINGLDGSQSLYTSNEVDSQNNNSNNGVSDNNNNNNNNNPSNNNTTTLQATTVNVVGNPTTDLGVFSVLPAEMILHILSFLPFEDVLLNVSVINRNWKKLVDDDTLWKKMFATRWMKEVQEEEERRKLRKKEHLKQEYLKKLKKAEEEYNRKKKQLEEEYKRKQKRYKKRRKKENWRYLFENRFIVNKFWNLGKAWLTTISVQRTINCLLYDEEKDIVICGNHSSDGQGGEIRYYDIKKSLNFKRLPAHDKWVRYLLWYPSSTSPSDSSPSTPIPPNSLQGSSTPSNSISSPNPLTTPSSSFFSTSDKLFSCSNDKTIKLWDMETCTLLALYSGHENNVPMITLLPSSSYSSSSNNTPNSTITNPYHLMSCSRDQTVKLWDISTTHCISTYTGHIHAVNCITSISSFPTLLLSGDRGGICKLWDTRTANCVRTFTSTLDVVQCLSWVGNGNSGGNGEGELVVGGGCSKRDEGRYPLEVWDVGGRGRVKGLGWHGEFVWAMQYDETMKKMVTGGADKSIRVWDMCLFDCIGEVLERSSDGSGGVTGPNGQGANGGNKGWRHTDSIYTLHFSSSKIVSGSKDKTLKIWKFGKGHHRSEK
eukprot:TRINITY_DN777_c3_g1_i1.p1 TRINITY_DN777_c3_g1~~TRINITY_DN777_c3_g1_i1.p1  ORF type:complete len:616 (+),score=145.56 TRINITY_DN777_c3_g1_i1:30-1877(+)